MIEIRPSQARGQTRLGWLDSRHTFSFGHYHDPRYSGHGPLIVINDDTVAPGRGFGAHGHRDMEILSFVIEGALAHRDSLGNGSVIRPGEIQRMTAGTGIRHSEFNASPTETTRFLKMWIVPAARGLVPGYEQRRIPDVAPGTHAPIASPAGGDSAVALHQDATLHLGRISADTPIRHVVPEGRLGWLQVVDGALELDGTGLEAGDGAALTGPIALSLGTDKEATFLVFDLPPAA